MDIMKPLQKSLESKEEKELVISLITALPEPQRSLVHLRHIEGEGV